ncbi:hypothetical protein DUNSADRAFT_6166 [Dunaliella salina]|uniref:Small ribosomal subunit protein uS7 domain-containing protein n=1 Tax=Dunaliella salina TaxID=3046 RepID=A0ABQ7GNV0_DUNSA|nr:hypothetical protein DUNSADRAFT_6166 [Dunaliella salina]|eukprot:KAF5836289.1 hypothetical protein DUNSADRAFT_6166 [Dunaliella salina]
MQGLLRSAVASTQEPCLLLQPAVGMALRDGHHMHSAHRGLGRERLSTLADQVSSSSTSPPLEPQVPHASTNGDEDAQQAQAGTEQEQQQQEVQPGHEIGTSQQRESEQAQHWKPGQMEPPRYPAMRVPLANKQQVKEARLSAEALRIYNKLVGCLMKDGKKQAAQNVMRDTLHKIQSELNRGAWKG